MLKKEAEKE